MAPSVTRKLLDEFRRARPAGMPRAEDELPSEPLTGREERVLSLVAEGRSNKQIANTLCLTEGTVKNYVSRIMEKLGARTRTELAVKALRRPKR